MYQVKRTGMKANVEKDRTIDSNRSRNICPLQVGGRGHLLERGIRECSEVPKCSKS